MFWDRKKIMPSNTELIFIHSFGFEYCFSNPGTVLDGDKRDQRSPCLHETYDLVQKD